MQIKMWIFLFQRNCLFLNLSGDWTECDYNHVLKVCVVHWMPKKFMFKSMLLNKHFHTWHLFGWQHDRQPIRSHVRKFLLNKRLLTWVLLSNSSPWRCLLVIHEQSLVCKYPVLRHWSVGVGYTKHVIAMQRTGLAAWLICTKGIGQVWLESLARNCFSVRTILNSTGCLL